MIYRHQLVKDEGRKTNVPRFAFVLRPSSFVFFDSKKKASKKPDPRSG